MFASPNIFGPNEDEPLDIQASRRLFESMTDEVNADKTDKLSLEQVAAGFLRVANETMCRPIRTWVVEVNDRARFDSWENSLTEARGYESASHHLVMFGGAGGQHGCSIATTLGIKRIIVPRLSSLLSAYGMALADVVREATEPAAFTLSSNQDSDRIASRISAVTKLAEDDLLSQGFSHDRIKSEKYLNCRYHGSSTQLMIPMPDDGDWEKAFFEEHKQQFGFNLSERDILVDDLRVRAVGRSEARETRSPYADMKGCHLRQAKGEWSRKKVYFDGNGWMDTAVVPLKELSDGEQVNVSYRRGLTLSP
jgi:5-oxoprolinase (ATP-hydrolysing)